eukprot:UN03933
MCSGHTMLYTSYLFFIFQLDIRSILTSYIIMSITVLLYIFSISMTLLSRDHYTIDVVVSLIITTLTAHGMAMAKL